jgi:tRNA-dihydrouridine synthase C
MGADLDALARTAQHAVAAGAPLVDLNFGCPAKGAIRGCAGSAVLREPNRLEAIVRACHRAVGDSVPVTAKIRAGYDDALLVESLARAAEAGGARLLTVHCRTRRDAYRPDVDWTRIGRAVEAVSIPVCGNGGIRVHADLERMRRETGCRFAMVGQAALADPWIFSGRRVDRTQAAAFLVRYAQAVMEDRGGRPDIAVRRIKQLVHHWSAGGLICDAADRRAWLRETEPARFLSRLAELASAPSPRGTVDALASGASRVCR